MHGTRCLQTSRCWRICSRTRQRQRWPAGLFVRWSAGLTERTRAATGRASVLYLRVESFRASTALATRGRDMFGIRKYLHRAARYARGHGACFDKSERFRPSDWETSHVSPSMQHFCSECVPLAGRVRHSARQRTHSGAGRILASFRIFARVRCADVARVAVAPMVDAAEDGCHFV